MRSVSASGQLSFHAALHVLSCTELPAHDHAASLMMTLDSKPGQQPGEEVTEVPVRQACS